MPLQDHHFLTIVVLGPPNPILLAGYGLSSSTTINLSWQEDSILGDINLNDAKGKKRDHHEISSTTATTQDEDTYNKEGTTTTSQDEQDANSSNEGGTTTTSEEEDASNSGGTTTTSEYKDASNKGGTTVTSDDEEKNNKEGTTMTCQDDTNNKQMTAVTTLYRIIHSTKVECFKDLDDAFLFIEEYKRATANRLQIQ